MSITSGRRARRSRAQWQSLIERGERSAFGISAFCAGEGVSTASYYAWRKRLGRPVPSVRKAASAGKCDGAGAFVELGALGIGAETSGSWDIELALGNDVVLRLRRG